MRFVIGGTFCSHTAGALYYAKLLNEIGADLIAIPRYGLGRITHAVDGVIEILDRYNTSGPVDLVGHSQGGLVAVAVANRRPDLVERVVAIGAPFAGAYLAGKWSPVGAIRDMAPHSHFLTSLSATREMLAISLKSDLIVRPYVSGALVDMPHIRVQGGHVNAVWSDELIETINLFLDNDLNFDEYLLEAA